jgi:hypothetical protein
MYRNNDQQVLSHDNILTKTHNFINIMDSFMSDSDVFNLVLF